MLGNCRVSPAIQAKPPIEVVNEARAVYLYFASLPRVFRSLLLSVEAAHLSPLSLGRMGQNGTPGWEACRGGDGPWQEPSKFAASSEFL